MVVTLILWVYQLLIIIPFGLVIVFSERKLVETTNDLISKITIGFLLGITILTTLVSILSLVINIGFEAHIIVLVVSIVLWILLIRSGKLPKSPVDDKPLNKLQIASLGLLILVIAITLLSATTLPENPDTKIYHAQTIHWIETYRAIPGLGNLHSRLAFNSSWLVINALFSLSFLNFQSFHVLPSLLYLIAIAYFFRGVISIGGGERKTSSIMRYIFFVASLLFLSREISSPGTDLPVTLFIWIIISELVQLLESEKISTRKDLRWLWLSAICLFCTTIKLSSVIIILLVVWTILVEIVQKRSRHVITIIFLAFVIYFPFISRNIIISGHLFYPNLKYDPIQMDWGMPIDEGEEETSSIHWFAVTPRVNQDEFNKMTLQEQYRTWFFNQIPRHKAILAYLVVTPILMLLLLAYNEWRKFLKDNIKLVFVLLIVYLGVTFWLITAPDFRFGYGFILTAVGLPAALIFHFITEKAMKLTLLFSIVLFIMTTLIGVNTLNHSINLETIKDRLIIPIDYPVWKTEICKFGNFSIQCASEWAACWYYTFPCAINGNDHVFMRGSDISSGFKYVP